MSNTIPLPSPEGFYLRDDDSYIGGYERIRTGDYTADQMHAHAAAVSAAKDAEIERLRAEVAGLREDAERYRHMRNNSQFQSRNGPGLYWYLPRGLQGEEGEQLDAAIDAALAARKGEA